MFARIISSIVMLLIVTIAGPANAARVGPIVAVGDSIVYGVGTSNPDTMSWPAQNGYIKVGTSGACVVTVCFNNPPMVDVFDSAVLSKNPGVVIIAFGINDVAAGQASVQSIVDGLANLMWRARAAGATAYVTTLTPVGPRVAFLDPGRVAVNAAIRAQFRNVIDTETALINRQTGMLKWAYDSGDNLHPNYAGYQQIAAAVRTVVQ